MDDGSGDEDSNGGDGPVVLDLPLSDSDFLQMFNLQEGADLDSLPPGLMQLLASAMQQGPNGGGNGADAEPGQPPPIARMEQLVALDLTPSLAQLHDEEFLQTNDDVMSQLLSTVHGEGNDSAFQYSPVSDGVGFGFRMEIVQDGSSATEAPAHGTDLCVAQ